MSTEFNRRIYFSGVWKTTRYKGVPVYKYPTDLWMLHEIISETAPEVVVETGTAEGGSALYLWDQGCEVITIDVRKPGRRFPSGITFIQSDSLEAADQVGDMIQGRRTMVVLDSDHRPEHVTREIASYAPMVTPGCYLVVEDTGVDVYRLMDAPEEDYPHGGPGKALQGSRGLLAVLGFEVDPSRERFGLTMNPGGWWRRRP